MHGFFGSLMVRLRGFLAWTTDKVVTKCCCCVWINKRKRLLLCWLGNCLWKMLKNRGTQWNVWTTLCLLFNVCSLRVSRDITDVTNNSVNSISLRTIKCQLTIIASVNLIGFRLHLCVFDKFCCLDVVVTVRSQNRWKGGFGADFPI